MTAKLTYDKSFDDLTADRWTSVTVRMEGRSMIFAHIYSSGYNRMLFHLVVYPVDNNTSKQLSLHVAGDHITGTLQMLADNFMAGR